MSQTNSQQLGRVVTVCEGCGVVDGVTLPANKLDDPGPELLPCFYHYERCGTLCGDIYYEQAAKDVQIALDQGAAASFFKAEYFDWWPPGVVRECR